MSNYEKFQSDLLDMALGEIAKRSASASRITSQEFSIDSAALFDKMSRSCDGYSLDVIIHTCIALLMMASARICGVRDDRQDNVLPFKGKAT